MIKKFKLTLKTKSLKILLNKIGSLKVKVENNMIRVKLEP